MNRDQKNRIAVEAVQARRPSNVNTILLAACKAARKWLDDKDDGADSSYPYELERQLDAAIAAAEPLT